MRTKSSITSQARRVQIIGATVRVIEREGLAKASFGRIAGEAGLSSPGMISYHFADKDELLAAVCDTILDDCAAALAGAVSASESAVAALSSYLFAFVRWQDDHRTAVAALWQLAAGWRRPASTCAFDESSLIDPLRRALREGRGAGAWRPLHQEWVAQAVFCAGKGYPQARYDDPDLDADAFARTLVDLFTDGLRS